MTKLITIALASTILAAGAVAHAAPASSIEARTSMQVSPSKAQKQLLEGLKPADDITPRLNKIKSAIQSLSNPKATKAGQIKALKTGLAETKALDASLARLKGGFISAERKVGDLGGSSSVDDTRATVASLRKQFEDSLKDIESHDRMGNFEIQRLMSQYNQSEQLASSVQKKKDDTANSVISKVG